MRRAPAIFALLLAAAGAAAAADSTVVPGAIFVQTARDGATLTLAGAQTAALPPGATFAASGQSLSAPAHAAVVLILSNGDALYLPEGGRLTLDEFSQEPVADTSRNDRTYEPSRSVLRLHLAQGTLAVSGRRPVPTSTLTLVTPLAQFSCQSQSFVVRADADHVTLTLFDGTADVSVPATGFHDTLQAGQSATLSRANLHAAYPFQLATITTADRQQFGAWLAAARTAETRVIFAGAPGKLKPSQLIPQDFMLQMSVDDPRFR